MQILAIETSCDETAAAVVEEGQILRSNVVASQVELHRRFGGVFPELASRQHVLAIQPVIRQALQEAGLESPRQVDALAVTQGPGLAGSLLVGINTAKGLSLATGVPLLPVNHLEGHIYSNWISVGPQGLPVDRDGPLPADPFPVVVLIVSGGHTELVLMTDHGVYRRLGGTLDDAAGEAFDKVARLLGLGYPGGPAIQRAAQKAEPGHFALPRPLLQSDQHRFNFSFSGLKTAVLNLVRGLEADGVDMREETVVSAVAAEFQQSVVDVLVTKTLDAARSADARLICICGGVSANGALRQTAHREAAAGGIPLRIPPLFLCTDNAAMIGAAAFYRGPEAATGLMFDVRANYPLSAL